MKLASCKSSLTASPPPPPHPPTVVYSTDRSKAVVPGVSLTLCCFVVYSTRRFVVCLSVCHFVLVFFSPFNIAVTSLGEERANLSAFRTFVRFVLVWICRFPLPLGVWEGLRFVIEALFGLFSYLSSDIIVRTFFSFFPHCELSHFSPSVYRQWVPLVSATPLTVLYDRFETLHKCSSWYEDMHVIWI